MTYRKFWRMALLGTLILASSACGGGRHLSSLKIVDSLPDGERLAFADGSNPAFTSTVKILKHERFYCTGVLVTANLVLSAAHCFDETLDLKDYQVVVADMNPLHES